jgi:hypothetical protein
MILMIPGTNGFNVKMPIGLGIAAFYNMGREIAAATRGAISPMEAAAGTASDFASSFNPLGSGGSLLNLIAPTAVDPVVDIYTNKDFTGKPIQPEQSPYEPPTPEFRNYFSTVNPVARWFSDGLNKATGGDDVQPGLASVSPDVVQYLFGYVTGGAGRFVGKATDLVAAPFDPGAEVKLGDIRSPARSPAKPSRGCRRAFIMIGFTRSIRPSRTRRNMRRATMTALPTRTTRSFHSKAPRSARARR